MEEIKDDPNKVFDLLIEFSLELFQGKVSEDDLINNCDFSELMKSFLELGKISGTFSPKAVPMTKKK